MSSKSWIFCNSSNVSWCTIFSSSHLTLFYCGTGFCVPLFFIYKGSLLASGYYNMSINGSSQSTIVTFTPTLGLVPLISSSQMHFHVGQSFLMCPFDNKNISYCCLGKILGFYMAPTILPPLASIVLLAIPSWFLVIWLIAKPSSIISSRILMLLRPHCLFGLGLHNIYEHICAWPSFFFFGALIRIMIIIFINATIFL